MRYEELGDTADDRQGGFHYTHADVPRRGKPVSRSKIITIAQALDYAAAGFHVCVDQANKERDGSNHHVAWQAAADDYFKAFRASPLQTMVSFLVRADASAASAPRVTRTAPPKPGAEVKPLNVNPSSPVPPSEQILAQDPPGMFANLTSAQIGGIPVIAIVPVAALLLWKKFGGKKGRGRTRRRRRR